MINQITTTNMMGLRGTVTFKPKAASIIAGPNGHGKTSLVEAIRLALLGGTGRVDLKKELAALVTDGEKKASATVGTASGAYSITLPDGKGTHIEDATGLLPILLEPHKFAQLKDGERRRLVLTAGGVRLGVEAVRAALAERNRDSDKGEAVLPLLRQGFDEASSEARRRATEAKGAWRAITGETYGGSKADDWSAPVPAFDADALTMAEQAVVDIESEMADSRVRLGQMQHQRGAAEAAQRQAAELREAAGQFKRRSDKLARDEQELAEWKAKLAALEELCSGDFDEPLACPCCGGALKLEGNKLVEFVPATATADDHKALAAARETVAMLTRTVANSQRDLKQSETAKAQLDSLTASGESLDELDRRIAVLIDALQGLNQRLSLARDVVREHSEAKRATESAATKTATAAAHRADVQAWTAIAEDLQPNGIQAQMTSKALLPLQQLLAKFSDTLGWRSVELNNDMAISAGGRPYRLLSESEQWRVDLVLAMALATLSGIGLVVIDRFDVLDLPGRGAVLDLIDTTTAGGMLQVIIAGTLKAAPDLGDDWAVLWLGDRNAVQERAA
ncbi:MAG: AAA family ATPase [Gammaproteobacteria bacterium]|nr:AAA family ATPase [Gammaproteobacteria bacterium]